MPYAFSPDFLCYYTILNFKKSFQLQVQIGHIKHLICLNEIQDEKNKLINAQSLAFRIIVILYVLDKFKISSRIMYTQQK